jgi:glutaredoxin
MAADRKSLIGLAVLVAAVVLASQWWASRQQLSLGRQVAAIAAPGDIRMLSSTTCSICTAARLWFKTHDVAFDECFIETDRACAAQFEATRSPGTPVIVVRGRPQIGFDPQRVRDQLNRS